MPNDEYNFPPDLPDQLKLLHAWGLICSAAPEQARAIFPFIQLAMENIELKQPPPYQTVLLCPPF